MLHKKLTAELGFFSKRKYTKQGRQLKPILDCDCQGGDAAVAEGEEKC